MWHIFSASKKIGGQCQLDTRRCTRENLLKFSITGAYTCLAESVLVWTNTYCPRKEAQTVCARLTVCQNRFVVEIVLVWKRLYCPMKKAQTVCARTHHSIKTTGPGQGVLMDCGRQSLYLCAFCVQREIGRSQWSSMVTGGKLSHYRSAESIIWDTFAALQLTTF